MNIKKFKLIFIGCCNKDQTHFIIFTRLANRSFSLDCGAQGKSWSKQPSSSYQHTFHNYNKCQSQKYHVEFWSLNFFYKLNILIRIFKLILKIYIIYMHMVNLHLWSHGNFTMAWTLGFKLITHCLCNPTTSLDVDVLMIVFTMLFVPNVLQKSTLIIIIFFILFPNEKL